MGGPEGEGPDMGEMGIEPETEYKEASKETQEVFSEFLNNDSNVNKAETEDNQDNSYQIVAQNLEKAHNIEGATGFYQLAESDEEEVYLDDESKQGAFDFIKDTIETYNDPNAIEDKDDYLKLDTVEDLETRDMIHQAFGAKAQEAIFNSKFSDRQLGDLVVYYDTDLKNGDRSVVLGESYENISLHSLRGLFEGKGSGEIKSEKSLSGNSLTFDGKSAEKIVKSSDRVPSEMFSYQESKDKK